MQPLVRVRGLCPGPCEQKRGRVVSLQLQRAFDPAQQQAATEFRQRREIADELPGFVLGATYYEALVRRHPIRPAHRDERMESDQLDHIPQVTVCFGQGGVRATRGRAWVLLQGVGLALRRRCLHACDRPSQW